MAYVDVRQSLRAVSVPEGSSAACRCRRSLEPTHGRCPGSAWSTAREGTCDGLVLEGEESVLDTEVCLKMYAEEFVQRV